MNRGVSPRSGSPSVPVAVRVAPGQVTHGPGASYSSWQSGGCLASTSQRSRHLQKTGRVNRLAPHPEHKTRFALSAPRCWPSAWPRREPRAITLSTPRVVRSSSLPHASLPLCHLALGSPAPASSPPSLCSMSVRLSYGVKHNPRTRMMLHLPK